MAAASGSYYAVPVGDPTSFKSLKVDPWRQFNAIHLDLSKPLTVITGTNGTGKTTLLNLIGVHFDWHTSLIGTPSLDDDGHLKFKLGSGISAELKLPAHLYPGPYLNESKPQFSRVGSLKYENGVESRLLVHETNIALFPITYEDQQNVEGVFLNSHRSISEYQEVGWIPAKFSPARELLENFRNEIRARYFGHPSEKSTMLVMKESLLAAAMYGEGNSAVRSDDEARDVWMGFQEILRLLLPKELAFRRLRSAPPEILLETETGAFTVDSLSGGLRAIFELSWQIFLRSYNTDQFTVCLDEPENHLHPSLQRTLMPNLMRAFPRVKFIVATHSPFIIRSTKTANVYGLSHNDLGRVDARLLDLSASGLSAEDTLRDVLGLESTRPIWAESKLDDILFEFTSTPPTRETIRRLKAALDEAELSSELPLAIETLVQSERNGGN